MIRILLTCLVLAVSVAAARSAAAVDNRWLSSKNEPPASTTLYLEKHGPPNCHKFWAVSIDGVEVRLTWGRLGGFGSRPWKRTTSLTFETPTIARKEAIRRLKVKLRNGYTVKKGEAA